VTKIMDQQHKTALAHRLDDLVAKASKKSAHSSLVLAVDHPDFKYLWESPVSQHSSDTSVSTSDQNNLGTQYHTASIGKLFTLELILQLIDQERITLATRVTEVVPNLKLEELWADKNKPAINDLTIEHLLTHTSGIPDYFSGIMDQKPQWSNLLRSKTTKTNGGSEPILDQVIKYPDRYWTPEQIFDRVKQGANITTRPGERFEYSDTGYLILGFIAESVYGKDFGDLVHEYIFDPAGMTSTQLAFPNRDSSVVLPPILPFFIQGTELSRARSLSCDWAGSGVITTGSDLLKFNQWFWAKSNQPVRSSLRSTINQRFRSGIGYGLGIMELRLGEFSWFLKGFPQFYGHIGVTATHLWYEPKTQLSIALNLGDTRRMKESFILLIQIFIAFKREGLIW
jgi:D-alanyl-D-alanine carboxypeptidase